MGTTTRGGSSARTGRLPPRSDRADLGQPSTKRSPEAGRKLRALSLVVVCSFAVLSVATVPGVAAAGNFSTLAGAGTDGDPYVITDAGELQAMGQDLDAHYVLGTDIDASATSEWNDGKGFEPIQGSEPLANADDRFSGTFDGEGHAISNLTINRTGEQYDKELTNTVKSSVGLFGFVGEGSITNVSLANVSVTGIADGETNPYVGALAAYSLGGTVSNVSVSGTVNGTGITDPTGGLVGQNEEGTVVDSSSSANVTATDTGEVGGLVGLNLGYTDGSSILNSTASGDVTGDEDVGGLVGNALGGDVSSVSKSTAYGDVTGSGINVGGLIGHERGTLVNGSSASGDVTGDRRVGGLVGAARTTVRESHALGDVTGTEQVGGLVGIVYMDTSIEHSYAVGTVSDATNAGGLVGKNDGTVQSAYWNADNEPTGIGAGDTGGATGLTTAEMTGDAAADNMTALDFPATWTTTDVYPRLNESVTGLAATVDATDLDQGTSTSATATLQLVDGTTVPVTTVASYASSDTAVATVDAAGVVTADAVGSSTITVEHAGETDAVTVTTLDTTDPTADAGANRTVDEGAPIELDAAASTDNDVIASYEWDLYDNGTVDATGETVTHTYGDAGSYTVTLTTVDAAGNEDTDTVTVTVESTDDGTPADDDGGASSGASGGSVSAVDSDGDGESGGSDTDAGDSSDDEPPADDGTTGSVTADADGSGGATATTSVGAGGTASIALGDAVRDGTGGTAITAVTITVAESGGPAALDFRARPLSGPPSDAEAIDTGSGDGALSYFELTASTDGDRIQSAVVRFVVDDASLAERGLDQSAVALYRYDDAGGTWEALDTRLTAERDAASVYEATTSEFSVFAVAERATSPDDGTDATVTEIPTGTPTPADLTTAGATQTSGSTGPGFGVVLAAVALLLVSLVARRRAA